MAKIPNQASFLCLCEYFLILGQDFTVAYGVRANPSEENPCLAPSTEDHSMLLTLPGTTNVTLTKNIIPEVQNRQAKQVTIMQSDRVVSLDFSMNLRNGAEFENCLDSINDPSSPN